MSWKTIRIQTHTRGGIAVSVVPQSFFERLRKRQICQHSSRNFEGQLGNLAKITENIGDGLGERVGSVRHAVFRTELLDLWLNASQVMPRHSWKQMVFHL